LRDDTEYISNPRPMWDKEATVEQTDKRIFTIGGNTAGVVIRVTTKGVEFNGYYADLTGPVKRALLRDFITVDWDQFDRMRADAFNRKRVKKVAAVRSPDDIDEMPDQDYLDSLPIVTLNGTKYYFDAEAKQRRPVHDPKQVFNFETQAAKKPS
jgi:hypothetical protein